MSGWRPGSDQAFAQSGLTASERDALLDVALKAAEAGGAVLRSHFGQVRQIREKGRCGDLVTEADLAAETTVLDLLRRETPDLGVLAEESGRRSGTSALEWCVDPLDGTTNFAHGYPFFGCSVGLCWQVCRCWGCWRCRPCRSSTGRGRDAAAGAAARRAGASSACR